MKYKKIICEGTGGTGKSTQVKKLAEKFGWDTLHCTNRDLNTNLFYEMITGKNDVVFDRHVVGELVYPVIYNRETDVSIDSVREMVNKHPEALWLVFTADINTLLNRIKLRNEYEPQEEIDRIKWIKERFEYAAKETGMHIVDTTNMNEDETFKYILNLMGEE